MELKIGDYGIVEALRALPKSYPAVMKLTKGDQQYLIPFEETYHNKALKISKNGKTYYSKTFNQGVDFTIKLDFSEAREALAEVNDYIDFHNSFYFDEAEQLKKQLQNYTGYSYVAAVVDFLDSNLDKKNKFPKSKISFQLNWPDFDSLISEQEDKINNTEFGLSLLAIEQDILDGIIYRQTSPSLDFNTRYSSVGAELQAIKELDSFIKRYSSQIIFFDSEDDLLLDSLTQAMADVARAYGEAKANIETLQKQLQSVEKELADYLSLSGHSNSDAKAVELQEKILSIKDSIKTQENNITSAHNIITKREEQAQRMEKAIAKLNQNINQNTKKFIEKDLADSRALKVFAINNYKKNIQKYTALKAIEPSVASYIQKYNSGPQSFHSYYLSLGLTRYFVSFNISTNAYTKNLKSPTAKTFMVGFCLKNKSSDVEKEYALNTNETCNLNFSFYFYSITLSDLKNQLQNVLQNSWNLQIKVANIVYSSTALVFKQTTTNERLYYKCATTCDFLSSTISRNYSGTDDRINPYFYCRTEKELNSGDGDMFVDALVFVVAHERTIDRIASTSFMGRTLSYENKPATVTFPYWESDCYQYSAWKDSHTFSGWYDKTVTLPGWTGGGNKVGSTWLDATEVYTVNQLKEGLSFQLRWDE